MTAPHTEAESHEGQITGLESVELVPEYPGMIRVSRYDGMRLHYLADQGGILQPGRPVIEMASGYRVVFFWPLEPYARPRVIKIEPL